MSLTLSNVIPGPTTQIALYASLTVQKAKPALAMAIGQSLLSGASRIPSVSGSSTIIHRPPYIDPGGSDIRLELTLEPANPPLEVQEAVIPGYYIRVTDRRALMGLTGALSEPTCFMTGSPMYATPDGETWSWDWRMSTTAESGVSECVLLPTLNGFTTDPTRLAHYCASVISSTKPTLFELVWTAHALVDPTDAFTVHVEPIYGFADRLEALYGYASWPPFCGGVSLFS
jgi:hypothetical protein